VNKYELEMKMQMQKKKTIVNFKKSQNFGKLITILDELHLDKIKNRTLENRKINKMSL